jgi:eukaryotic translation initiation factor 2C
VPTSLTLSATALLLVYPSAAVVGSVVDGFAKFSSSMRLQRSKSEVIMELNDMVMGRLLDWDVNHNGELPGSILFYRDGVSESKSQSVRDKEISKLQQAYDQTDEFIRR